MHNTTLASVLLLLGFIGATMGQSFFIDNSAAFNDLFANVEPNQGTSFPWFAFPFVISGPAQEYTLNSVFLPDSNQKTLNLTGEVRPHNSTSGGPSNNILGHFAMQPLPQAYPQNDMMVSTSANVLENNTQYWITFVANNGGIVNFTNTLAANQGNGNILLEYILPWDTNVLSPGSFIARLALTSCLATCPPNSCGQVSDRCGRTLSCGNPCQNGQVCNSGACCTPQACNFTRCGAISNGCGSTINCACPESEQGCSSAGFCCNVCGTGDCTCLPGKVCNFFNQAGPECCVPQTCNGIQCGAVSDGCGGTLSCTCPRFQVCFEGACCTPNSDCYGRCGTFSDDCGGTTVCDCCTPRTTCPAHHCVCSDGCGGTLVVC